MREGKWKSLSVEGFWSVWCVLFTMFFSKYIFITGTGQRKTEYYILIVGVIVGIIVWAALTAILRMMKCKLPYGGGQFMTGMGRGLLLIAAVAVFGVVVGIICGGISTLIYRMFSSKSFAFIKGIVNCITGVVVIEIMPFGISVFWRIIQSEHTFLKAFSEGVKTGIKVYFKLMLMLIVIYAAGILIIAAVNCLRADVAAVILKVILLSGCGLAGLEFSKKICRKEAMV